MVFIQTTSGFCPKPEKKLHGNSKTRSKKLLNRGKTRSKKLLERGETRSKKLPNAVAFGNPRR
jgi:hypothetical protein